MTRGRGRERCAGRGSDVPGEQRGCESGMSKEIATHVPKPRRRPSIRGHNGIERGSEDAARLFWQHADAIGQATGPDVYAALPTPSRYGFASQPTPPDKASRSINDSRHRLSKCN